MYTEQHVFPVTSADLAGYTSDGTCRDCWGVGELMAGVTCPTCKGTGMVDTDRGKVFFQSAYVLNDGALTPYGDGGYHLMYAPQFSVDGVTWHHGWDTYDTELALLDPTCAAEWLRDRDDGGDVRYRLQPYTVFADGEDVTCDHCGTVVAAENVG